MLLELLQTLSPLRDAFVPELHAPVADMDPYRPDR